MSDALDDAAGAMAPISLEDLEAGAALRRRLDTKYVVGREALVDVLARAADDYQVLEIDRRRAFTYESVYFDTPELRSFAEHVGDVRPRFKSRSRLYRETGYCVFEVKVKDAADTTRKRQCPYLAATLATRYRRVTLAAREGGERVTIDLDVAMESMDDREVTLREDTALVETKTDGEGGVVDALLASAGCEPTSISKYRLGIGLLVAPDPQAARLEGLRRCFVARPD
jgi:hypothetical protein